MTKVIEKFIKDMEIRNLSAGTRDRYLQSLLKLSEHYQGRAPESLTDLEVQDYIHFLAVERKLTHSYINTQVAGFKFFYSTTMRLNTNNFVIPTAKVRKKLPEILNRQEVRHLFQAAGYDLRKTAYFSLLYGCGLRGSEACNLRIQDVDSGSKTIWVRNGKGGKDRGVFLPDTVYSALSNYWRACRFKDLFFVSRKNPKQAMDIKTPQSWMKELKRETGIQKNGLLHLFRHSYATHALEDGENLLVIKKNLGHSSIKSTMIYLQLAQIRSPNQAPIDRLFLNENVATPTLFAP